MMACSLAAGLGGRTRCDAPLLAYLIAARRGHSEPPPWLGRGIPAIHRLRMNHYVSTASPAPLPPYSIDAPRLGKLPLCHSSPRC